MTVQLSSPRVLLLLLALTATGSNAQIDVCGTAPLNSRADTRIVGGQDAAAGAWPWQARLRTNTNGLCGGSLINNQWVLSAAHCFGRASSVSVSLGLQNAQGINPNSVSFQSSQIIVHPDYDSGSNDNDLALVKLPSAVEFTNYIRPVCLAADGSVFADGLDCWVTGFGTINEDGSTLPFPQTLQEVDVPIVSNSRCSSIYSLTNNMLCAGLTDGGKDSCQGDSGGPLVTKNGTVWVQAGIVSFGSGCARPDNPGVYTRVSRYQSWINSQITGAQPGFINFQGSSSGAARLVSLSLPLLLSVAPVVFSLFVLS
ncbi:serine protease 27-like [Anableps anableps]